MEKKHTAKEMQDYITARECLIMVQGWCNDIRNHSTNHQDIELIGFYMKSLSRLINDIHIGGQEVTGVIEKYAPLIKNDQLNMNFIRNEYRQLRPFVQSTLFDDDGQPVIDFINLQTTHSDVIPVAI